MIHRLGYLFSAPGREGLIADELVLQLATFLRSLDLFLELTVPDCPANSHNRSGSAWRKQACLKSLTGTPEVSYRHA